MLINYGYSLILSVLHFNLTSLVSLQKIIRVCESFLSYFFSQTNKSFFGSLEKSQENCHVFFENSIFLTHRFLRQKILVMC